MTQHPQHSYRFDGEILESNSNQKLNFRFENETSADFYDRSCNDLEVSNFYDRSCQTIELPNFYGQGFEEKKSRTTKKIFTWIRKRTSNLDCGLLIDDGHPIHLNKNHEVLEHFEKLRNGQKSWLERINNQDFEDHRNHRKTFYFAGQSQPKFQESLVLLDIDCKKTGTPKGALEFADYLREHHFPNLYIEVSTNGNGAHGFFVLKKDELGPQYINTLLLRQLQPWLRDIMVDQNFDVENIEVKGTMPVLEWGNRKLEVTNYKAGTLAKLPRIETAQRELDLMNTSVWSATKLQRLRPRTQPKRVIRKAKKTTVPQTTSTSVPSISIVGKHIPEEELLELSGHYQDVATRIVGIDKIETKGRTAVVVEDVAIFLMLIKFFTTYMNKDGSLPVKRWKKMWSSLKNAGDINRAFCAQRFSAIRNHLSSLGLLAWQNKNFEMGWYDNEGKYHKGNSAKWKAGKELMDLLQKPVESEDVKKGERERASFIRTNLQQHIEALESGAVVPVYADSNLVLMLNPDEIAAYVPPLIVAA